MRDRTRDFHEACSAYAASHGLESPVLRHARVGRLPSGLAEAAQLHSALRDARRHLLRVESRFVELGGAAAARTGPSSASARALDESRVNLKHEEIRALSTASRCERRAAELGGQMAGLAADASLHYAAVFDSISCAARRLLAHVKAQQRARRAEREAAEAQRNRGIFAPQTLSAARLAEIRAKSARAMAAAAADEKSAAVSAAADDDSKSALARANQTLQKRLERAVQSDMDESEQKLAEMSDLMTTFSREAVFQLETLNKISENEEEARGFAEAGVQEMTKAAERAEQGRVWTVTVLLLASFSILFLDWYG